MNYRILLMAVLVSAVPLFLDARSLPKDPEDSAASTKNIYDRFTMIENMDSQVAETKPELKIFETSKEIATTSQSPSRANRKPASFSKGE